MTNSKIEDPLLPTLKDEQLNYEYFRSKLEKRRWVILLAFSLTLRSESNF